MKSEFHLSAVSGLISAGLAQNSVLFAWRNPPLTPDGGLTNTRPMRIKKIEADIWTVAQAAAAVELSLAFSEVTAFGATPADYTGGTDLSHPTTDSAHAYRSLGPEVGPGANVTHLQSGNVMIATTAGLSHGGTPTIKTHAFASKGVSASTIVGMNLKFQPSDEGVNGEKGLILIPTRGFVIRNPQAWPATATLRLAVNVYWQEG